MSTAPISHRGRSRSPSVLIAAALAIVLVGALAALLAWPAPGKPASMNAPAPGGEGDPQLAAMQDEIRMLRRRLDLLSRQPPATTAAAKSDQTSAGPPPVPLTQEEVSARDRRRFEGLATKLAAEPVDARWAPATERLIADTLGKPEFKGSKLLASTCRSTLCRFEVGHDDEKARRRFSSSLPNRLPSLPSGSMRNAEGSDPRTIVYVAREGHRIPRDDPQ